MRRRSSLRLYLVQVAQAQSDVLPDLLELVHVHIEAAYRVVLHSEDQQNQRAQHLPDRLITFLAFCDDSVTSILYSNFTQMVGSSVRITTLVPKSSGTGCLAKWSLISW